MVDRKGYGEQFGPRFGMLLSVIGFLIVLVLPAKDGWTWKRDWGLRGRGAKDDGGPSR